MCLDLEFFLLCDHDEFYTICRWSLISTLDFADSKFLEKSVYLLCDCLRDSEFTCENVSAYLNVV